MFFIILENVLFSQKGKEEEREEEEEEERESLKIMHTMQKNMCFFFLLYSHNFYSLTL